MPSVVIVAIPEQDDSTWKISSEKVPHITLLFLGEADAVENAEQIVQYVEHAASKMSPFYMDVDYRGSLGADEADVLFFEKGWDFKAVSDFRDQLLANPAIKAAYNKAEQFPEWTPHLTLGYPATPANIPDNEERMHYVRFDRIAVWLGDSEGPEFRLTRPDRGDYGDAPLAMSDSMTAAEARSLLHFGLKGMKWGVRKETAVTVGGKTKMVSEKKAAKLDKKFEKQAGGIDAYIKIHNAGGDHFDKHVGALNAKYSMDLTKPGNEHHLAAYDREAMDLLSKSMVEGAKNVKNATGTRSYEIHQTPDGDFSVRTRAIAHAEDNVVIMKVTRDKQGKITKLTPKVDVLKQGEELIDGILHSGVKGMKWGVRKEKVPPHPKDGSVLVTAKSDAKGKAVVNTVGGTHAPAHADALKAAGLKTVATKSGLNALSNKELQDLATRMNLEQQVNRLNPPQVSRGQAVIKALFGTPKKQEQTVKMAQEGHKIIKQVQEAQKKG